MATTPVTAQNNPVITGSGLIALDGECWDQSGNKIGRNTVVLRIINGAIATVAISNTLISDAAASMTFAGVAPTVTPGTVTPIAPPVGAMAMVGVAPTVAVS